MHEIESYIWGKEKMQTADLRRCCGKSGCSASNLFGSNCFGVALVSSVAVFAIVLVVLQTSRSVDISSFGRTLKGRITFGLIGTSLGISLLAFVFFFRRSALPSARNESSRKNEEAFERVVEVQANKLLRTQLSEHIKIVDKRVEDDEVSIYFALKNLNEQINELLSNPSSHDPAKRKKIEEINERMQALESKIKCLSKSSDSSTMQKIITLSNIARVSIDKLEKSFAPCSETITSNLPALEEDVNQWLCQELAKITTAEPGAQGGSPAQMGQNYSKKSSQKEVDPRVWNALKELLKKSLDDCTTVLANMQFSAIKAGVPRSTEKNCSWDESQIQKATQQFVIDINLTQQNLPKKMLLKAINALKTVLEEAQFQESPSKFLSKIEKTEGELQNILLNTALDGEIWKSVREHFERLQSVIALVRKLPAMDGAYCLVSVVGISCDQHFLIDSQTTMAKLILEIKNSAKIHIAEHQLLYLGEQKEAHSEAIDLSHISSLESTAFSHLFFACDPSPAVNVCVRSGERKKSEVHVEWNEAKDSFRIGSSTRACTVVQRLQKKFNLSSKDFYFICKGTSGEFDLDTQKSKTVYSVLCPQWIESDEMIPDKITIRIVSRAAQPTLPPPILPADPAPSAAVTSPETDESSKAEVQVKFVVEDGAGSKEHISGVRATTRLKNILCIFHKNSNHPHQECLAGLFKNRRTCKGMTNTDTFGNKLLEEKIQVWYSSQDGNRQRLSFTEDTVAQLSEETIQSMQDKYGDLEVRFLPYTSS